MELIEPEREAEQGALPEPEPRYKPVELPAKRSEHGQAWIRIAAATVVAVILVILIVLLARFIYHKAHNHAGPAPAVTQNTPAISNNNPKTSPAPAASPTPSSSNSNGANTGQNAGSNSSKISNTGPGNVVAIFAGASLAAAGLHYLVSVRRSAKGY